MMTESNRPLSEVLNASALAMPVPNAGISKKTFVGRYPEHADALTEFAVELTIEFGGESDDDEDLPATDAVSEAAGRAISHLQNYTFELERKAQGSASTVTDPFQRDDARAVSRVRVRSRREYYIRDEVEGSSMGIRKNRSIPANTILSGGGGRCACPFGRDIRSLQGSVGDIALGILQGRRANQRRRRANPSNKLFKARR